MRLILPLLACTLTNVVVFVASHPMLIRNIICKTYYVRRTRLAEVWYAALLKELNCLNFNEQTSEWKLQTEALEKLQHARQRFILSLNTGKNDEINVDGVPYQYQIGGIPYSENTHTNVRGAFENYKNECSEVLGIIRQLNALKQKKMRILPNVQEIYSKHQIYTVEVPFISDIFRFKFREFVQINDEFEEQIEAYLNDMGPEETSKRETLKKSLRDVRDKYETRFTDLKEKIQDELIFCVQRYSLGTHQYRKQIKILGDTYKKKLSELMTDFRSECLSMRNDWDTGPQRLKEGPVTDSVLKDREIKKLTPSDIETELEKLLQDYWQTNVLPQLQTFDRYLEEILCLTLQTTSEDQKYVYDVLHSLQLAKRRFGDALWHARRDARRNLWEIHKQLGINSPEYSDAVAAILDAWQENMTPHLTRFIENLHEMDDCLTKLYKQTNLDREQTPKGEKVDYLGDVRIDKIFGKIISPLIVGYDSCIEDLSELDYVANTPEGNYKAETLAKLQKARLALDKNISELRRNLEADLSQHRGPDSFEEFIESYRSKLAPLVEAFKNQLDSIDTELEQLNAKQGHSGRRELFGDTVSPWHLQVDNYPIKNSPSLPRIVNFNSDGDGIALPEPFLDDIFRECYRSVVIDFDVTLNQLRGLKAEKGTPQYKIKHDVTDSLQTSLGEYGKQLNTLKSETLAELTALLKNLDKHSVEYQNQLSKLTEQSNQKLKTLRDTLDSTLDNIKKTLEDNKMNLPSSLQKVTMEQRPDGRKQTFPFEMTVQVPPKMNDELMYLLREYWIRSVLPKLQDYHRCLEDINNLPHKPSKEETKDIYNILRSLELAKRRFGDKLWDARQEAIHNMEDSCRIRQGLKSNDYANLASQISDSFQKNMQPFLAEFSDELQKFEQLLGAMYKDIDIDRPSVRSEIDCYKTDDLDDRRFQAIFDAAISSIILEYDIRLENLCESRVTDDSLQNQNSAETLKKLQQTQIALEKSIRASKSRLKEELKQNKQKPDEMPGLIEDYRKKLATQMAGYYSELQSFDNELKSLNNKRTAKNTWPSWQHPTTGQGVSDMDKEQTYVGDQNLFINSKSLPSFPDAFFNENDLPISEPVLHDLFQKQYTVIVIDFNKMTTFIEDLDCEPNTPFYQFKHDALTQINAALKEYMGNFGNVKKEAVADLAELHEMFVMGSPEYIQHLYLLSEKFDKNLTEIDSAFQLKRENVNEYVKEKFPNRPKVPEKTTAANLNYLPSAVDEELVHHLNDWWLSNVLPRLNEYHQHLEEVNALLLKIPKKDNTQIYEMLRALQMAKRQFGDALWSQRRDAIKHLMDIHKRFKTDTPDYFNALQCVEASWRQKMAPQLENFTGKLFEVDKRLPKIYKYNTLERPEPPVYKKIEFGDDRFDKLFENCILLMTMDYDNLLEGLSELFFDAETPEGHCKAKAVESLLNSRQKFWTDLLLLQEELHHAFSEHKDETEILEKLFHDYGTKIEVLSTTFKTDLKNIIIFLKNLNNTENHPSQFQLSGNSIRLWGLPAGTLDKQETLMNPVIDSLTKSSDSKSRNLGGKHDKESLKPSDEEVHPELSKNQDVPPVQTPRLYVQTDIAPDQLILPEPVLDDLFRVRYRNDILCFDSIMGLIIQLECQPNTSAHNIIQEAIRQLQAALAEYAKELAQLKKAAITDLSKVSQNHTLGSPEYWTQVSSLLKIYDEKLENLKKEFQAKMDAVQNLISDNLPNVQNGYRGNNIGEEGSEQSDLSSGNIEFIEFLDSYWLSLVLPQLQILHQCLADISKLSHQQKTDKERLYELLRMLQQAKRRFNDAMWQMQRETVQSIKHTQKHRGTSPQPISHVLADVLNLLRQKIAPHLSKFRDEIQTVDKTISNLYESGGLQRLETLTGIADDKSIVFDDSRFDKLFIDATLLFIIEFDGQLEYISVTIVFNAGMPEGTLVIDVLQNLELCRKNFEEALLKLRKDLHTLLSKHKYEAYDLERLIAEYHTKILDATAPFTSKLVDIDMKLKDMKLKYGLPYYVAVPTNCVIPWRHLTNIGNKNSARTKPVTESRDIPVNYDIQHVLSEESTPKNKIPVLESELETPTSEIHTKINKDNNIDLPEPFIDDIFRDEYRAVITAYDNMNKILNEQECQPDSSLYIFIQDALEQLHVALTEYVNTYIDLKQKASVDLINICKELAVDSPGYRNKISSLLKTYNGELKTLHDIFDATCNRIHESLTSQLLIPTQIPAGGTTESKTTGKQFPNVHTELDKLLSDYWRTVVIPELQKFHHCLEDINSLILQLNAAGMKEIYDLLRSLQLAKRQFGDALWHGRHDITGQLQETLKGLRSGSKEYLSTLSDILTAWQKDMAPHLNIFSEKLKEAEILLSDLYKRNNLNRNSLPDDTIFDFNDSRFRNFFCNTSFSIIIEYDCRLDDISKLILDVSTEDGRLKSDTFVKLLQAWSGTFSSILDTKKELIAELAAGTFDTNSISSLIETYKSKLEAHVRSFRSLLEGVDSILKELMNKFGLSCRQYSTSVSLSPWRVNIETGFQTKHNTNIISAVAHALL